MEQHAILTSFSLNPQDSEHFLIITCRPMGILSWPLSKLKLVDSSRLTISPTCLDFRSNSFKHFSTFSVPLASITAVSYGLRKPWGYLLWAALFLLLALLLASSSFGLGMAQNLHPEGLHSAAAAIQLQVAALFLLLSLLFALCYFLKQHFHLRIEHGDDRVFSICLHPGLMERLFVKAEDVDAACSRIRSAMLESRHPLRLR